MLIEDTKPTFLSKAIPRISGNDIPEDVWWLIAEQLALITNVLPLMGLNRAFLDYALRCKYREVEWSVLSDSFLKRLERLQEPAIARRVRVLHIRAWFIEYLLRRDALFDRPSVLSNSKAALLAPFVQVWSKIHGNARQNLQPQSMLQHRHRQDTNAASCTRVISSMIKAIEGMNNVVQLNFEWRDLPLNPDTRRFLVSTTSSLDKNLRKLVLRAQLPNFKELLDFTNFDHLEELSFHFDYTPVQDASNPQARKARKADEEDPEIKAVLDTVIPFIERRQSSLRALFISSTSSVNLSPFFNALPSIEMSNLRRFGLQIFYSEHTLSDPSAFIHIPINQSFSLRHLSLLANIEQPHGTEPDRPLYRYAVDESKRLLELRKSQWNRVNELLLSSPRCLTNLESLEIPFVSLRKTMPLLARSCDTLTRLRLVDHYLTRKEVTEVLTLFNHRPLGVQHLHIDVQMLDFELFELLATRLPDLTSLVLVYNNVAPVTSLIVNTPSRCLLEWKLHELEVHKRHFNARPSESDSRITSREDEEYLKHTLFRWISALNTWNRIHRY